MNDVILVDAVEALADLSDYYFPQVFGHFLSFPQ